MERRTAFKRTLVSAALFTVAATKLHAQNVPGVPVSSPITLRGTSFDSLRNKPLSDATAQSGIQNARVSISWMIMGVSAEMKLKQTRFTLETMTD